VPQVLYIHRQYDIFQSSFQNYNISPTNADLTNIYRDLKKILILYLREFPEVILVEKIRRHFNFSIIIIIKP